MKNTPFRIDHRTALVTGCSRGLGQAMAEALAEAGADVIGISATLPLQGSETGRLVEAHGRKFHAYTCDLSCRSAVLDLIEMLSGTHPEIDILVNNAGAIIRETAEQHPDSAWDSVLETNLTAPFLLSKGIGAGMLRRNYGKIIFTASLLSFQGGIRVPGYAASKGGIAQLTKALANEWASRGINVNAIAPGYMATDNTAALRADPERSRQILERIPAGRWGHPNDIKGPLIFLASDASAYVHGEVLTVDGGWMGR